MDKKQVYNVGKIDIKKYSVITADIKTNEVIITDTQINHIKERHPNDLDLFYKYGSHIIENPDYMLEANKPNTAVVLKEIVDNDNRFQLILRLKTSDDPLEFKNSIITFMKIDEKRYKKYLKSKKILYKRE